MQIFGSVLTLGGAIVVFAALLTVHLLPTGLNPLRDPVSQYGITRFRGLYAAAAFGAAVAAVGAILVLVTVTRWGPTGPVQTLIATVVPPSATVAAVFLGLFAAARVIIPFVPMDRPNTAVTGRGRAHNVLAFIAFASVTVAAFVAGGALHESGFVEQGGWSTVFAIVMALGSVGVLLSRPLPVLHGIFGLSERLIYVGFIAWFVVVATAGLA